MQFILPIILIISSVSALPPGYYPVVLVPGDGGNQLEAKLNKSETVHYICDKTSKDYFTLWLNIGEFVEVIIDCWVDNAKLDYNNVTRKTTNRPGVDIRVPGWGDTFTVDWLDPLEISAGAYFKDISNALVSIGYQRNVSVRGAPFDFRKAPNELGDYYVNLKALVEETYTLNNNTPVIVVAHSMGAPMSHYFLQNLSQDWKDKYIKSLITLSGAWAGSVKSVKVFYMGDDLGVFLLPNGPLRKMQMTMPSIAWLLPWPQFWKPDEVLVQTPTKNYSLSNLKNFFYDINYVTGWEMTKDQSKYWTFDNPGVEIYCFHGSNVSTTERLVFAAGEFPNGKPTFINGDGDGTVNARSLEACTALNGMPNTQVHHKVFPGVDHQGMLHSDIVVSNVVSIITSGQKNVTGHKSYWQYEFERILQI